MNQFAYMREKAITISRVLS